MAQIWKTRARKPIAEGHISVAAMPSEDKFILAFPSSHSGHAVKLILSDKELLDIFRSALAYVHDDPHSHHAYDSNILMQVALSERRKER